MRGLSEGEFWDILTNVGYQGNGFIRFFNRHMAEESMLNMDGVQLFRGATEHQGCLAQASA